jgi:general L-amino acid transport system permease protein
VTGFTTTLAPPGGTPGRLRAFMRALFGTPLNAAISIACMALVLWVVPPLFAWAIENATWVGSAKDCKANGGACWALITEKFRFMLFGFYPYEEQWRPLIVTLVLVGLIVASTIRRLWRRQLLYAWATGLPVMFVLMLGGFGLSQVSTEKWGGLPVTLLLSVFGLALAFPLAILLALGRRSHMPVIRSLSVGYIEIIRGVPLITLLFMASILFPLFLPQGVNPDKLLRAQVAIILFAAAYIAEVVRAGLQGIGRGQYEAADALGLTYWRSMRLIILPQALKMVIPPLVNTFIGFFKDTTLILIVGLFDFLTTVRTALTDPNWQGFADEAYVFAALVYFLCCFAMSKYSQYLEKLLNPERRR